MKWIKKIISWLPAAWQTAIRRIHYKRQITKSMFESPEPEYQRLPEWVKKGDWVVDLGANIGHYTLRLSDLVGHTGRVVSFEPVSETFAQLCGNCAQDNVTLINAAASDCFQEVRMHIPTEASGLPNHYQAQISEAGNRVAVSIPVDSLGIDNRVALIKIDVEGHEVQAVDGAWQLICRHKPILIIEHPAESVIRKLESIGYQTSRDKNSPNKVFEAPK